MNTLPTDAIIFGILARATMKTVGRCKSVCKEWYASLSTPEFEMVHVSRSSVPSNQRTLIIDNLNGVVHTANFETGEYGAATAITCPFTYNITNISVLSHLDGLLCVWVHDTHALFLWNPTTTRYKELATSDDMGIYIDSTDTIGLYKHSMQDYRVMHISRSFHGFDANIHSRETAHWRTIHFNPNVDYLECAYHWSPGTQCGDTLYFTVYKCLDVQKKTIVTFDINIEHAAETQFPPVESVGMFVANLITIQNKLHMFVTSGLHEMILQVWVLRGEQWINTFSNLSPPHIPVTIWSASTHYMTNGAWFLMSNSMKVLQVGLHPDPVNCFHCVASTIDNVATLFLETLASPSI